ncbi:MAG TPA: SDR family oxidoreductase [Polyangiaceae bacterium]|nr:SDR family oxidoreductase [Polyangiaceae bacterium]
MKAPRTFLVSGCASGIGKHMALSLARTADGLMVLDRNAQGLEAMLREHGLADSPRIVARTCDVRDAADWERIVAEFVERFGTLDAALNIAGVLATGYVHQMPVSEIDLQIDVNAKGVMYATRAQAQVMLRQGSGHIVNIASLAGISHVPGMAAYCASKHAVRAFSLATAHELAPHGVRVSVICPDAVETPMLEQQTHHPEAAMTFAGGRGLTLDEIERVISTALETHPLEVIVPVPRSGRGVLAKISNLFPGFSKLGLKHVQKRGLAVQAKRAGAH